MGNFLAAARINCARGCSRWMGNCNAREPRARPEQPACPVSDPAALHQPDETERQQRDAYGKGQAGPPEPVRRHAGAAQQTPPQAARPALQVATRHRTGQHDSADPERAANDLPGQVPARDRHPTSRGTGRAAAGTLRSARHPERAARSRTEGTATLRAVPPGAARAALRREASTIGGTLFLASCAPLGDVPNHREPAVR